MSGWRCLVVVIVLCSGAAAQPPNWYVGVSGQRQFERRSLTAYPSALRLDDGGYTTYEDIGDGYGFQIEAGRSFEIVELYGAFNHHRSVYEQNSFWDAPDPKDRWTTDRILFGLRLRVREQHSSPLTPWIGFGTSVGWTESRTEWPQYSFPDQTWHMTQETHRSPAGVGVHVEAGFRFHINDPLVILIGGRLESLSQSAMFFSVPSV